MLVLPVHVTMSYAILLFLNVASSNEFNRTRNNWTPLNDPLLDVLGTWSFDDNLGTITQDIRTTPSEASIVLPDKQWYIGSESLYINYSYSIDYLGSTSGFSGLEILSSTSASWCEFYLIIVGLWEGKYWIELSRGDANANRDNYAETILLEKRLSFTPQNDAIYTLSLEIIDGTTFNIKYNNELLLQHTDTSSPWQVNTGYSGYILLWSAASVRTTAHSLDISGLPTTNLHVPPYDVNSTMICTTANPTTSPTHPTQPPTREPSTPPTASPTPPPTQHPSLQPFASPTAQPSSLPSQIPSVPPTDDNPLLVAPDLLPTTHSRTTILPIVTTHRTGMTALFRDTGRDASEESPDMIIIGLIALCSVVFVIAIVFLLWTLKMKRISDKIKEDMNASHKSDDAQTNNSGMQVTKGDGTRVVNINALKHGSAMVTNGARPKTVEDNRKEIDDESSQSCESNGLWEVQKSEQTKGNTTK